MIVGCAPAVIAQRPYPAPTADDLLAALRTRQTALRTLNIQTRTTSWLGDDRFAATVLMLVDRTGRLRFEAEVSLRGTVAVLVTDGTGFSFFDMQHGVFKQGLACPQSVATLIRIPLVPREIAAVLLGDAPIAADARPVQLTWDGALRADVLELQSASSTGDATTHLWVSLRRPPSGGAPDVVAVEGQIAGRTGRWRVGYDRFETVGSLSLPSLIRFAEPGKSFDDGVEIKVKNDRVVNGPLRDEAFALTAPPGIAIETIPCRSR